MDTYNLAIQAFEKIRDIPYHISTNGEGGFDCEDKARMLIAELNKLDIPARNRICLFQWSVLPLAADVAAIPHDAECSHTFVELQNQSGEWVFVDPTWNSELAAAGFEIATWDGVHPTPLAMKCDKILSPEDSIEYVKHIDYEEDMKRNSKFYDAINTYCDSFVKR